MFSRRAFLKPAIGAAPNLRRRRFLQGLTAGGVLLGLPPWFRPAASGDHHQRFDPDADAALARGRYRDAAGPQPPARGHLDPLHGILLPYQMDGVPGISFNGIPPGESFTYRFKVQQSGTYWYHSHSGMQEQTGMYGAIIIDPPGRAPIRADREYIVQFSDWTDENPHHIMAKLRKQSDYYNFNQPTVAEFFRDAKVMGVSAAFDKRKMWNQMRMNPDRSGRRFRLHVHLPYEWRHARRKLGRAVHRGEFLWQKRRRTRAGFGAVRRRGARLRYEIRREFAPYVGIEWAGKYGGTADHARAAGERTRESRLVAGLRFWF